MVKSIFYQNTKRDKVQIRRDVRYGKVQIKIDMKKFWRLWAKALGEKIGETNKEADKVAFFRTMIILQAVITNILISLNILINWLK